MNPAAWLAMYWAVYVHTAVCTAVFATIRNLFMAGTWVIGQCMYTRWCAWWCLPLEEIFSWPAHECMAGSHHWHAFPWLGGIHGILLSGIISALNINIMGSMSIRPSWKQYPSWNNYLLSLRYWWQGYCVYGFQNLQLIRVSHIPQTTYSFRVQKLYFYGYFLHDCLFRLLKMRLSMILQMKSVYIRIMRSEIRRSRAQNIHWSLCSFWGCMLLLLKPSELLWWTANEAEVVDCLRCSFSYHWCMTLRFRLFCTLLGGSHSGKFAGESFARPSWWFGVRMGSPTFTGQRWLNPHSLKK